LLAIIVNTLSPSGIPVIGSSPYVKHKVEEITVDTAWTLFQKKGTVFVDSRDRDEFKEGHIQGAVSFPTAEFDRRSQLFMDLVSTDTLIVTYCNGKGCDSSMELAELLLESGYAYVKVFFGGWQQWKDAGYPVQKDTQD